MTYLQIESKCKYWTLRQIKEAFGRKITSYIQLSLKSLQNALPEDRQFLECIHIMSLYLNLLSKEQDNISSSLILLKQIKFGAKITQPQSVFFSY